MYECEPLRTNEGVAESDWKDESKHESKEPAPLPETDSSASPSVHAPVSVSAPVSVK